VALRRLEGPRGPGSDAFFATPCSLVEQPRQGLVAEVKPLKRRGRVYRTHSASVELAPGKLPVSLPTDVKSRLQSKDQMWNNKAGALRCM